MRSHFVRRSVAAALGSGGVLLAVAIPAQAQPAPNCTAADLAGIATGVSAATSAYLFTHPPVNEFFTSLLDMGPDEKEAAVTEYADANPQIAAELRGIRQPLTDFRHRCHHLQPPV
ncbi:heme-binding protein [Mycobacterium sp. 236(2023)]|uniref:heme-binding protein n=1 Tax=Mycobacterium sp. 236(2023) TaxID=3038163 RepID=UPI002414EEB9|nr:heme-binding protein [Mycobacterium sp. 236(2023)]MDG4664196.1 heme-binding protein [Mycobacterium sp. 236(2023)]